MTTLTTPSDYLGRVFNPNHPIAESNGSVLDSSLEFPIDSLLIPNGL